MVVGNVWEVCSVERQRGMIIMSSDDSRRWWRKWMGLESKLRYLYNKGIQRGFSRGLQTDIVILASCLCAAGKPRHQCSAAAVAVHGRCCYHYQLSCLWAADGASSSFMQVGVITIVVGVPLWAAGGGYCHRVDSGVRMAVSGRCRRRASAGCRWSSDVPRWHGHT